MFGALSRRLPAVMKNIKSYFALGPVAFVNHEDAEMLRMLADTPLAELLLQFKIYNFLPSDFFTTDFSSVFCGIYDRACTHFLQWEADFNTSNDNVKRMNIFMGHEPCGTSTMNMLHWKQMVLYQGQ